MNSGTRSNKIGVMGSFQKSFGINNWHSLGKGEKSCNKRKIRKDSRVVERWKKESIFGRGCCKSARMQSGRKKEDWKDFSKVECQIFLSREIVLGHPCVPRVRMDTGSDKRRV